MLSLNQNPRLINPNQIYFDIYYFIYLSLKKSNKSNKGIFITIYFFNNNLFIIA